MSGCKSEAQDVHRLEDLLLVQQAEEVVRQSRLEVAWVQLFGQSEEGFRLLHKVVDVKDGLGAAKEGRRKGQPSVETVAGGRADILWQRVLLQVGVKAGLG